MDAHGCSTRRTRYLTGWSIGPVHELRHLGAGVDAQLGERIVDEMQERLTRHDCCSRGSAAGGALMVGELLAAVDVVGRAC
jgi:hypothetical protein